MALVNLERSIAITIISETQSEFWSLIEKVGKEPVTPVADGDSERVRHFREQMHIGGLADLDRHFDIELNITVEGKKTPEQCRDDDKGQIKEN